MDEIASDSCCDLFVTIVHGRLKNLPFLIDYGHLSKLFVANGDYVKRGQVIGLTAEIPLRFGVPKYLEPHLHFELYQPEPSALTLSRQERLERILDANDSTVVKTVYNPEDYWLDSKPQCFDSNRDYSGYSNLQLTHPVACGAYGKTLLKKLQNMP